MRYKRFYGENDNLRQSEGLMAIVKQLSRADIERDFTHYGLFAGLVPCYVADDGEGCKLQVRNWWPDFLLDIATALYGSFVFLVSLVDDDYEPGWPIVVTGEIEGPHGR